MGEAAKKKSPVISEEDKNCSRRFTETFASTALVMVLGNIVSGKRKTLKSETAVKAVAGVSSPYAAEYTAKVAKAVRMGAVAHMAELTMFKI